MKEFPSGAAQPCIAAIAALLFGTATAAADPASPDKTDFTLFYPTPDADLRGFSSDRPDKGSTPYTVDAGHFQYETDLVGTLYDSYGSSNTRTRQVFAADPVLKLGITNTMDVEIGLGGYQNFSILDRSTGKTSNFDGFGDVTVRAKVNLIGNDGGNLVIALDPFFKIPTATRGLGNGAGEFGLTIPLQYSLPYNVTLQAATEFDDLRNADNTGRNAGFTNLVSLNRSIISPKLTASLEIWSEVQTAHMPSQYTLDPALSYMLSPNTQLDTAAYIGLNKAAPDFVVYVGLSQRF